MSIALKVDKETKLKFGNQKLSDWYDLVSHIIYSVNVSNLSAVEETESNNILTICGIWKFVLSKDINQPELLKFMILDYEKNYKNLRWVEADVSKHCPKIFIVPFLVLNDGLVTAAIDHISKMCGYSDFDLPEIAFNKKFKKLEYIKIMPNYKALEILKKQYKSKLNKKIMVNKFKRLLSDIHKYLINKDILKIALSVNFRRLTLCGYLKYQKNCDAIINIKNSHPNLTPLLEYIPEQVWSDQNLFSQKYWVRNKANHRTKLEKLNKEYITTPTISGTQHLGAYRYLLKAPHPVVAAWCNNNFGWETLNVMGLALRNNKDVFALAVSREIARFGNFHDYADNRIRCFEENIEQVVKVYFLYFRQTSYIRREHNYKTACDFTKEGVLSLIFDWAYDDLFQTICKNKNLTWNSLIKFSNKWHEDIVLRRSNNTAKWSGILKNKVNTIKGATVVEITNTLEIHREGVEMHHCVAGYEEVCLSKQYHVFSITGTDGVRSTLGVIYTDKKSKKVKIHQHYGHCNSKVSDELSAVGHDIIKLINSNESLNTQ